MYTIENYEILKEKYKALKYRHKCILRHLEVISNQVTSHEVEILDINVNTMFRITEHNKKFNKN